MFSGNIHYTRHIYGRVWGGAQAHVAVVLTQVLPGHAHWRFASGAGRWPVSAAALRVLRLALQLPPPPAAAVPGAWPLLLRPLL